MPKVPEEFRRLEQREAGCVSCHGTGRVPELPPDVSSTPEGHPDVDGEALRRAMRG